MYGNGVNSTLVTWSERIFIQLHKRIEALLTVERESIQNICILAKGAVLRAGTKINAVNFFFWKYYFIISKFILLIAQF